jgi:uncharacterized protein (TIGR02996 family)
VNTDQDFTRAIVASPDDEALRLVYADWLEERGESRAEFVRLESAHAQAGTDEDRRAALRVRLQQIQTGLDPKWIALIDRPAIENCATARFVVQCPRLWEKLTVKDDGPVRSCSACRGNVFYCASVEEARDRASRGERVAVASWLERRPGDVVESRQDMLRRINRTVREYEFLPVDGAALGEPMRVHLAALSPQLTRLGFEVIGDFRMKPEPIVVHDRILLSEDGLILATICCVLQAGVPSFISVLADGTCIHTTGANNPHPERTFLPGDRMLLNYHTRARPHTLLRRHRDTLRTAATAARVAPLRLQRDQFRAVMVYDQRLFNRWRYRHGTLDQEPPAPDFNTLQSPQT